MTLADFAFLVQSTCGIALPPSVPPIRLWAFGRVESRHTALAIGVNRGGRPVPRARTEAEAVDAIRGLIREGANFDAGLMQINHANWRWLGLTPETAVRPCDSVRAGLVVLLDADRRAACVYNTGADDCRRASGSNGYPEKILAAHAEAARQGPPHPVASPAPPAAAPCAPSWDVWAGCAAAPAKNPPGGASPPAAPITLRGQLAMGTEE